MHIQLLQTGALDENCWLLWKEPEQVFVVDPGDEPDLIAQALEEKGLVPAAFLLTHGHLDHLSAISALVARFPVPVYLHADDAKWAFTPINNIPPYSPVLEPPQGLDCDLREGRVIEAGMLCARVLPTPGHSPGGVCYVFDEERIVVAGDTLFRGSVGRVDLPGGNTKAMACSLTGLMTLSDDFKVLSGHGGTTTIGAERRNNPFIAALDEPDGIW